MTNLSFDTPAKKSILAKGKHLFAAVFAAFVLIASISPSAAQQENGIDRAAIEQIIREYLLENPELLFEVQQAFEAKQQAQIAEQQKQTLVAAREEIFNGSYQIEFGSKDPKITIVEFFDYNCGFCQRAMADMQQLLESDANIKFVLKEFPVLGEGSMEASRVSMAFSKVMPEKHSEFHVRLLGLDGPKNGDRAINLALEMGAEVEKLLAEMDKPEILETVQETYQLANALGITGTPSYIVGDEVVFGAVGVHELQNHIAAQAE